MSKKLDHIWQNNRFAAWRPNVWDLIALLLVFAVFIMLAYGAKQMSSPYKMGEALPVFLDPHALPSYAIRTVLRMLIAMAASLIFTFTLGTLAAKNRHAERAIIPIVDILQSVPVIGFLSITIVAFIALFPNSLLGPECCAIFAIFTAQAWNMMLGFYQSLKTLPKDLAEAASVLQLNGWQRFWRVEVPFAMPSLIWNIMLSMSASWFFVVASEAITVNNQQILLPGIGSYIMLAISQANTYAVIMAIIAMLVVILLYDQLLFRPLVAWSSKFKTDSQVDDKKSSSWLSSLFRRTRLLHYLGRGLAFLLNMIVNFRFKQPKDRYFVESTPQQKRVQTIFVTLWYTFILIICLVAGIYLLHFIFNQVSILEAGQVILLGVYTALRVIALIMIASLIWVPIGVWIGMRPGAVKYAQPIVQILAAFPANVLFPVVVIFIVAFHLNFNIWATLLMMIGAQWYILFNVIAGASVIPKELHYVASNFGVKKWLWWKRFILPAILPSYITGAITAAGGAWNASIVAEVVTWGHTSLHAAGLGAYITEYTQSGDFPRIALGISIMCVYVLVFNRAVWQPLYNFAQRQFILD